MGSLHRSMGRILLKEEAAYVVREQFFERLEAVRLYEEEQERKER